MTRPTVLSSIGDFTVDQLFGQAASAVTATTTSATLNAPIGKVVTVSLNTAAGATYTLTLSNSFVSAGDLVFSAINDGTNSTGTPVITTTTVSASQIVFIIANIHATAAFNGTLQLSFLWIPFL